MRACQGRISRGEGVPEENQQGRISRGEGVPGENQQKSATTCKPLGSKQAQTLQCRIWHAGRGAARRRILVVGCQCRTLRYSAPSCKHLSWECRASKLHCLLSPCFKSLAPELGAGICQSAGSCACSEQDVPAPGQTMLAASI